MCSLHLPVTKLRSGSVVSVKRKELNFRVFKQYWNERIVNPYEREHLQYLTSEEKELVKKLAEKPHFKEAESVENQNIFERMKNFFR